LTVSISPTSHARCRGYAIVFAGALERCAVANSPEIERFRIRPSGILPGSKPLGDRLPAGARDEDEDEDEDEEEGPRSRELAPDAKGNLDVGGLEKPGGEEEEEEEEEEGEGGEGEEEGEGGRTSGLEFESIVLSVVCFALLEGRDRVSEGQ